MAVPRRTIDFAPRDLWVAASHALRPSTGVVPTFERALAETLEVPHVVTAASGRAALGAIVAALALRRGSRVVVPCYTDASVPDTLADLDHDPRFVDADPLDANPDARLLAPLLDDTVSAVVTAHHFGRVADLDATLAACERAGVPLVEDATHAMGARWRGRPVGTIGAAGYLSFNFTKPFSAFGGGALLTRDAAFASEVRRALAMRPAERPSRTLARVAKSAALWCATRRPVFTATAYPLLERLTRSGTDLLGAYQAVANRPGGTPGWGPISELSARIGLEHLARLPTAIARRRELAAALDVTLPSAVERLRDRPGSEGVAYFYVLVTPRRTELTRCLLERGIDAGHHLMHDNGARYDPRAEFPIARRLLEQSVQVPIHPGVRPRDLERVVRAVAQRS